MEISDIKSRLNEFEETFEDYNNYLEEATQKVRNALDKIEERFRYRTLENMSYSLTDAAKIEDQLAFKLDKIADQVVELYNLIG